MLSLTKTASPLSPHSTIPVVPTCHLSTFLSKSTHLTFSTLLHYNTPTSTTIPLPPQSSTSTINAPPLTPTTINSPSITSPISPLPQISPPPDNLNFEPINDHHMVTRLKAGISKPKTIFNLSHSRSTAPDPTSFRQAANHPHWRQAMSAEFLALQQQGTWTLVPPPPSANVLGCCHADGSVARHKARLVAQGFSQEHGIDFHETFSPVSKMLIIRTLPAVAAHHKWPIRQFDISNAFLHGKLDDIVYMRQPPGFEDSQHPTNICLLRKALYGLKQAPRMWYSTLLSHLHTYGFVTSTADPSLLIYHTPTDHLYMLVYVDDLLFTGSNSSLLDKIIQQLHTTFQLKDMGLISTFLGITAQHTPDG